jgi:hypothetical protein
MEKQKRENWRPFILLLIGTSFLWFLLFFLIFCKLDLYSNKSSFGYSSEAISALFSGLAFAAFLSTVFLQRKELSLQRQELEQTRIELKRAADAQEKSEHALSVQIKLMNITAKLNAYSVLFKDYSELAERHRDSGGTIGKTSKEKKEEFKKEIEDILTSLKKI